MKHPPLPTSRTHGRPKLLGPAALSVALNLAPALLFAQDAPLKTDSLGRRIDTLIAPLSLAQLVDNPQFATLSGMKSVLTASGFTFRTVSLAPDETRTITVMTVSVGDSRRPSRVMAYAKQGRVTQLDHSTQNFGEAVCELKDPTNDPGAQPIGYATIEFITGHETEVFTFSDGKWSYRSNPVRNDR